MKQPTLSFKIGEEIKTYPIINIHFDRFGNVFSVSHEWSEDTYTWYRQPNNTYLISTGGLTCTVDWKTEINVIELAKKIHKQILNADEQ